MTLVKMVGPGITLECEELDVPHYVRAGYKRASGETQADKTMAIAAGIVEPTKAEIAAEKKAAEEDEVKPLTAAEKKAAAEAHRMEPPVVLTAAERKAQIEGHTLETEAPEGYSSTTPKKEPK